MADEQELSIDEILAAARAADGGEESAPAPEAEAAGETEPEAAAEPAPAAGAKPAGEMSVEEMLAAARGDGAEAAASDDSSEEAAEPVAAEPAPAAGAKPAGEMSVEEMLAAARGDGDSPKEAPAAKPAAKKAAATPAATPESAPAPAEPTGPKDTGSLLAPRKDQRGGPLSHSQARDAGQESAPLKAQEKQSEKPVVPPMPVKPAYASPLDEVQGGSDRRGFFATMGGALFGSSLALGFTSLAVTHLLWLLGLARFMFPNVLTEPPTKFKVGFPDEFAPGQVETKFKAQFGIWLVRYEYEGAAQVYALKSVCTHLGCTPNWLEGEQKFKCPCHGSGFYKDGINFEGPAPRPLERYAIRLADDGQLEVDKSRKFNEELGQWSDPASFVSV